jgi:hypothetical protein
MFKSNRTGVPKYALEFEKLQLEIFNFEMYFFLGGIDICREICQNFLLTLTALTKLLAVTEEVNGRGSILTSLL